MLCIIAPVDAPIFDFEDKVFEEDPTTASVDTMSQDLALVSSIFPLILSATNICFDRPF